MLLSQLFADIKITGSIPPDFIEISGVCERTAEIVPGVLFLCKRGTHADAADYLDEIEQRGAVALLRDARHPLPRAPRIPCFYTPDIACAEAKIWSRFYGEPERSLRLVAVTGTNGKTSTALFLHHILNSSGISTGYIGTLGAFGAHGESIHRATCGNTTPSPEFLYEYLRRFVNRGITTVVLEVSSHALIQKRVCLLSFRAALFTNLSEDHLDYHKTMTNYFMAKRQLFDQSELAIINKDDEHGAMLLEALPCPCRSVGVIEKADFTAEAPYENGTESTQYLCHAPFGEFPVSYPLFGTFNVYNTLLAIAAAASLGACPEEIARAMKTLPHPRGRLEVLPTKQDFSIIIDYAHTPDAMEQVIKTVRPKTRGKLLLVFGTGGEREREKRPIMGEIACRLADIVFITTDNPRGEAQTDIFKDIVSGVGNSDNYTVIENRGEAICAALSLLSAGDTLLLLGKGHEEYILSSEGRLFFSEREIIHAYLEKKDKS